MCFSEFESLHKEGVPVYGAKAQFETKLHYYAM